MTKKCDFIVFIAVFDLLLILYMDQARREVHLNIGYGYDENIYAISDFFWFFFQILLKHSPLMNYWDEMLMGLSLKPDLILKTISLVINKGRCKYLICC